MSEDPTPVLSEWIGKYIEGTLSESEAQQLLQTLERSEEASRMLASGVLTHLFLVKHFDRFRDTPQEFGMTPNVQEPNEKKRQEEKPSSGVTSFIPESWEPHPLNHSPEKVFLNNSELKEEEEKEYDPFAVYNTVPDEKDSLDPIVTRKQRLWPLITTVIAFFVLIGLAEWQCYFGPLTLNWNNVPSREELITTGTVKNLVDVVWAEKSERFKRGHKIQSSSMVIESGIVNLTMNNGSEVFIEGPAHCTVQLDGNLFCKNGRISANVPPTGHGFEIVTPWGKAIDRGTEFMVDVKEKAAHIYVVQGKVELVKAGQQTSLTTGLASRIDAKLLSPPKKATTQQYLSHERFQSILLKYITQKQSRDKEKEKNWDSHPSLLCRFDLGTMKNGTVANTSLHGKGLCSALTLYNCDLVKGTLEETQAVHFKNQQSYGELTLPGTYQSLTLVCSIRMDQLSNNGNVFFVSRDYFKKEGGFMWQISSEGQLLFHVTTNNPGQNETFMSAPVFKKQDCGGWYTFAVVADGKNRKISHYIDGQLVASLPWSKPFPLQSHKGMLGNYIDTERTINNRYLTGNMNRFAIYERALSETEMAHLHIEE